MTDSFKYGLGALAAIVLLFLYNQNSQTSYEASTEIVFNDSVKNIKRIKFTDKAESLELVKQDSIWKIIGYDSLSVIDSKLDNIFDKILKTKREMLITSKEDKWSKFGVTDSLGKHFIVYDGKDNEIIHYIFGNTGQDYQHNYIRKNKSKNVYRTDSNVYFLLNTSPTYWGSVIKKEEVDSEE
jgi:hypothetical protein